MSNGGMIQTQRRDGTWKDAFPVGYKPESATIAVARKTHRPARLVDRRGKVLFECGGSK